MLQTADYCPQSISGTPHPPPQIIAYTLRMFRCPACSFEFELPPLFRRLESHRKTDPHASFSSMRRLACEIDCPNCKAGLLRIFRFKTAGLLVSFLFLAIAGAAFLGLFNPVPIFRAVLLPLFLLTLAGGIWDRTYPRLQLRKPS
jgi:hypothetical protein